MAVLAHCWLMIECFVIPPGFIKWFYLSFYIHPFFLPFCQIFLWLRNLVRFLYSPVKMVCFLLLFIFRFIVRRVVAQFPVRVEEEAFFDAPEPEMVFLLSEAAFETGEESSQESSCTIDSWLNDYLCSERYSDAYELSYGLEMNESVLPSDEEPLVEGSRNPEIRLSEYGEYRAIAEEGAILHFSDIDVATDDDFSFDSPAKASVGEHLMSFDSPVGASTRNLTSESPVRALEQDIGSESSVRESVEQHSMSFDSPVGELEPPLIPDYAVRVLVQQYPVSNSGVRPPEQNLKTEFHIRALEQYPISQDTPKDKDSFQRRLTQGFRFFNLLYQERLHGFRAISNEHIIVPRPSNATTLSADFLIEEIRTARPRILISLESDFELIYVAQISLYWESLYDQYQQAEILTGSNDAQNRLFHHTVSGKFQELQILLERFVEEENSHGLTGSDNIPGRLSFHCSIQVPDATEFIIEEHNSNRGEGIRPNEVLKAIKKCIEAFWSYINTDNKKSSWKYKSGVRSTHPTVEDPLDLELLYDVLQALKKKGTMMKHLMSAMIDMKLVERVLKLSLVSGSQLRWCRDKLSSLDFGQGRVSRSPIGHLFPCS